MKLLVIQFLILIVGISAILGFVLSEQQSTSYIVTDLDPGPHAPYPYESSYAVDMGYEEPFGLRSFEIIPDALGHPVIVGSNLAEYNTHDHLLDDEKAKQNFFIILFSAIGVALLIPILIVYGKDIARLIKKQ